MSPALLDLRCPVAHYENNVVVMEGEIPPCWCGRVRKVTWELTHKAPATDVHEEKTSEVLGISYRSSRDRDRQMKAKGFDQPAGDPVGGARPRHGIEGKAFSYRGQKVRRDSAKRTAPNV